MGKNKKPAKKSGGTKFIIIGIIAAIVAVGAYSALNSDTNSGSRLSLDTSKGSPILGSESAPVTIVEFGDYQCPFCQRWNINTKPLVVRDYINTGKVNMIYMDLMVVGADSLKAHAGSYCAEEQGLYWQYHDFLYANQGHENDGWASSQNLKTLVSQMDGIDAQAFSQCLDSGKYESRAKENNNIAMKAGARSTPSFIIIGPDGKGTQITGAQPYSTFQEVIEQKLAA